MPVAEHISSGLGQVFDAGSTNFCPLGSTYTPPTGAEALSQVLARSSYTMANLFLRVVTNGTTGSSTSTSRKNAAPGNMSVTIGAGLTGTFEDTVNTDSLVTGDLFCERLVVGAGGSINRSLLGVTLDNSGSNYDRIFVNGEGLGILPGSSITVFQSLSGPIGANTTEADQQLTFRTAATLSNLRVYVSVGAAAATTFRTRKNGANGNQSVIAPLGVTGSFEDTTNTDSVVAGDEICMSVVLGAAETIQIAVWQVKSAGAAAQLVNSDTTTVTISSDTHVAPAGNMSTSLTESQVQMKSRTTFTGKELYLNVKTHGASSGVNLFLRKNGVNTALAVNIPASTTGVFEDTSNTADFVSGDLFHLFFDHGGGAGSIGFTMLSFASSETPVGGGRWYPTQMLNRGPRSRAMGRGLRVP